MSKTTMTVLAAIGAVVAVLVLGVVIGFAVDSDDVDVATDSVSDERSDGDDPGSGDFSDGDDSEAPAQIEGFGDFIECLGDSGLGLEDIEEFDMDFGEFFSECVGGLLPEDLRDPFGNDEFDPFGSLEEFFEEGGEGGLGGLEEFFNEFEDGFDGFSERFEDGAPFDTEDFEDFWNELFEEKSDTDA